MASFRFVHPCFREDSNSKSRSESWLSLPQNTVRITWAGNSSYSVLTWKSEGFLYLLLLQVLFQPHAWRAGLTCGQAKVKFECFLTLQNMRGSYSIFKEVPMPSCGESNNLDVLHDSMALKNLNQASRYLYKLFCVNSWGVTCWMCENVEIFQDECSFPRWIPREKLIVKKGKGSPVWVFSVGLLQRPPTPSRRGFSLRFCQP